MRPPTPYGTKIREKEQCHMERGVIGVTKKQHTAFVAQNADPLFALGFEMVSQDFLVRVFSNSSRKSSFLLPLRPTPRSNFKPISVEDELAMIESPKNTC